MSLLFQNAIIFTGDEFIEQGDVLVEDGKIISVSDGAVNNVPADAERIACDGATLLPGLIDSHVHGLYGNTNVIEESLRFGVTTVMDMHNEPHHIAKLYQLAEENKARYADFKAAGTGATIKGGWPEAVVLSHGATPNAKATVDSWMKLEGPEDAEPFVEKQIKEAGASYIKIMHEVGDTLRFDLPHPSVETWKAVVRAAHAQDLRVVGHAYSYKGAMELLSAGVDGLTHMWLDQPPSEQHLDVFKRSGAHCNPTLSGAASQTKESAELRARFSSDPLAKKMLFDSSPREPLGLANETGAIANVYASTRALYEAGIPLIVGSDSSGQSHGQAYGLTVHMEIWQMVHEIGMAPAEVLKSSTSLIADRFGFQDRGRIQTGMKADLLLVDGDVRRKLQNPQNLCLPIRGVWRDGTKAEVYKKSA